MLLQTLMQLSQMYTPGPAMSLRTSAWLLPQKEHMVRFEARAICSCFPRYPFRDNTVSGISTSRPSGGVLPSNIISFRDLSTSSTNPYALASSADTKKYTTRTVLVLFFFLFCCLCVGVGA